MKNTRGQRSEVRVRLIALIPLIALLSLPSLAQKAGKGSLRDSALVVTNETDTAALAAVAAVADTWAAAIEQEAVYRGQGNAAQQAITVAATNALNAALGPRIVWATNRIEEVNAALAASFIEGLAAERFSRATNVAAWADAIWTDCRITNSATRLIAQSALAAASSVTGSQASINSRIDAITNGAVQASAASLSAYAATNLTYRIYNPTNATEWTDGSGSKWRIAPPSHWVLTVPENNDVLSITNLPYPLTGPFTIILGSYTLYAQGGGGSLEMVLGYGGVKTWINSVNYSPTCPTNIALYVEESSTQDANLKYVFGGTTSRVDTVVLLSDLAVTKELHPDSYTNLIWRTVWSNGWCWAIAYTNTP